MKKIILTCSLYLQFLAFNANALTYDQILAEYNGGVIGSVNNCGVNFSVAPQYLRGAGSVSLQRPGEYFYAISALGDSGVVSVVKNGNIFYSPDGLNLSGGGSTLLLGSIGEISSFSERPNIVEIKDEEKVLIQTKMSSGISRVVIVDASGIQDSYFTYRWKFIGYADGKVFSQDISGDIYSFNSTADLIAYVNPKHIEKTSKSLESIKSYNSGLLTMADGSLYYSPSSDALLAGASIENLYPDKNSQINQVVVVPGDPNFVPIANLDTTFFVPARNDHIVFSTNDGSIGWNEKTVLHPINADYVQNILIERFFNYSTIIKESPKLLDFGKRQEYGSGFFVAENISNATIGVIMGLNGKPATVDIADKGWTGWEYKWRDRGEVKGSFYHEYDGSFVGENEMRIEANNSCVVASAITFEDMTPYKYETEVTALLDQSSASDSYGLFVESSRSGSASLPGIPVSLETTQWPILNAFLSACATIQKIEVFGKSVDYDDLKKYGCPVSPAEYEIPEFNPNEGQHFDFMCLDSFWYCGEPVWY